MIDICKIHKSITLVQVWIIMVSCLVSSLGVVISHPIVYYAWYCVLACSVTVIFTSLMMGIVFVLSRVTHTHFAHSKSKQGYGWLSWKNCALIWQSVIAKHNTALAGHYQKKPAY